MGISVKINCDVCNTEKLQVNHWYQARITDTNEPRIILVPFNARYTDVEVFTVLCGEACVHKFISQKLATLHSV